MWQLMYQAMVVMPRYRDALAMCKCCCVPRQRPACSMYRYLCKFSTDDCFRGMRVQPALISTRSNV